MQPNTETALLYCTERNKADLDDLVEKITICARDAIESSHDALRSAISAGEHLTKAKRKVLYGKWISWLKQHFEFSHSTASSWMRLFENRKEILELAAESPQRYLSVNDALRLVSNNPRPEPKSKLQKVQKHCVDLIKEIYSQSPAEARKSRDTLIEHIKEVGEYIRKYTK